MIVSAASLEERFPGRAVSPLGALQLEKRGWGGKAEEGEENLLELSGKIIGSALRVHSALGPGLLEHAYEACLCRALSTDHLTFMKQQEIALHFEGLNLDCGFRLDLLVEDRIVVEIKAVPQILSLHLAQLRTYLKLSGRPLGLIINFNVLHLRDGIRQVRI